MGSITIRYFARLREELSTSAESLALSASPARVGDVRRQLMARGASWQKALGSAAVLVAVNQLICDDAALVQNGDELAFFPPVSGG